MSPSLNPSSPSFSGSKSKRALAQGSLWLETLEEDDGTGGLYAGGGLLPSSSESAKRGAVTGFGFR